jgi:hypothetical protein
MNFNVEVKRCGAEDRNRTGTVVTYRRILSPVRLPVPPPRPNWPFNGADDETRTRDPNLGKVVLYQLSYVRINNGAGEGSRTPTPKALDPKSSASANSATPA